MRFEKFTTKLQEALAEAQSAALGHDHQYIEPQHLLAALLEDQGMAGLIAKLEAKFGCKITATQSIDPELIGGVMVQVGDEVMDASVRGGLANLAVTLKA